MSRDLPYTAQNTLIYQPQELNLTLESTFQYMWLDNHSYYINIVERYKEAEWHSDISDPDDFDSEEERDERLEEMIGDIEHLLNTKYVIGVEEVYIKPGKFIDEETFESGELLCRVYVIEVASNEMVQSFLVRSENSLFVMTFSGDDIESRNKELLTELRQSLYKNIKIIWSES